MRVIGFVVLSLLFTGAGGIYAQQAISSSTDSSSEFTTFEANDAGTGAYQGTAALAINSPGEVTGITIDANGVAHGFLRAANAAITEFDAPTAGTGKKEGTFPVGINDSGEVVGAFVDAQHESHGFLWEKGIGFLWFDAPGAAARGTVPTCINAKGDVTGSFWSEPGGAPHGFLRTADGTFTQIDVLGAGSGYTQGTQLSCINAVGQITGRYIDSNGVGYGFIRSADGFFLTFAVSVAASTSNPSDVPKTSPVSIDEAGNVTGLYEDINGEQHSFVRTASGTVTEFNVPGASSSPCLSNNNVWPHLDMFFCGTGAIGINATKGITGGFVDSNDVMRGYIRSVNGNYTTFDAPNAGADGISGYEGTSGFGINSSGTIVGSYIDKNLVIHGFVYAPNSPAATVTALAASRSSSVYKAPVTFTARVEAGSSPAANGGSVTFMVGRKALGTEKIESGKAELTATDLPVGADSMTAVYAGSSGYAGSTSKALDETVGKAESSTTLTAKPNPAVSGEEVTLTAIVKGQFGGTATGSVTFYSGTETLKKVSLSSARAIFSTSSLSVGTHSIRAIYSGDNNFKASDSETISIAVLK